MKKICIIVSTPMTVKAFLIKHIKELSKSYEITVVSNSNLQLKDEFNINCFSKSIEIDRKINLLNDIKSVFYLYKFLKKEKFDLVLSVSPKAGLITSIASFLSSTKNRLHFFTGQVWATKKGLFKLLLKSMDKLITKLNTNILVDSHSQRNFLIKEKVISSLKSKVLLSGSISGVDIDKFMFDENIKNNLKNKYQIKNDEIVFMFIGRLNIDKGILDLAKAFEFIFSKYSNIKLFLIGPDEENIVEEIDNLISNKNVIRLDYVNNPEEILNIADVLVLPSYREGFGTIVIEAASMGIPTIASDIYGLSDAVVDKITGFLHNKKDINDMIKKYELAVNNIEQMKEFGINAKKRTYKEFKDEYLSIALKKYIDELLG
ncbi:MAG: glycosyltransferase family 1 protein [Arcobacter sp.]|nr:glycosyltransferase family 1 protein [Arcobacter sp.]